MSTNDDRYLKAFLGMVTSRLYTTAGTFLLVVGSIGSVMGCIVFLQKSMRQNCGSVYFIAYNLANLFSLCFVLSTSILLYFNIDPTYDSVVYCKLYYFLRTASTSIPPYYLILASIDRTMTTSSNASIRQRCTHRLAYWSIAGVTIVILLFWSHLIVFVNIYYIYTAYLLCYYPPGNYRIFVTISGFVVNSSLVPVLLGVFTLLTVRNIQLGSNTVSTNETTGSNSRQTRNRQFTIMLLAEVAAYVPFNLLWGVYSMYRNFTQSQIKSVNQQTIELFLATVFYLFNFIPPTINFYLHLLVSKSFRHKSAEIFLRPCKNLFHGQFHSQVNPTTITLQRSTKS